MAIKRDPSGRLQIDSQFMGESMMDKSLLASTDADPVYRLMPDLVVGRIGGQSVIDRGRAALLPILDELVAAREFHKILITTGGGSPSPLPIRVRSRTKIFAIDASLSGE